MVKFQTFSRCMKPLYWESTELGSERYPGLELLSSYPKSGREKKIEIERERVREGER